MHRKTFTLFFLALSLSGRAVWAQQAGKEEASFPYLATLDPVPYPFQYSSPKCDYLTRFREMYGLDQIIAKETTDLGRARALCQWVHFRLDHDGHKQFQSQDPFAILKAAMLGQQVQCVEFGLVLAAAFNAVGIPARPLYLKAANVQTKASAAGHALAEAWLPDLGKWVMVDSQADIIPMLGDKPLNAVELQQALLADAPNLTVLTSTDAKPKSYFKWVQQYLFYFDTVMDNRYGVKSARTGLMLVPLGAHKPVVFQRTEAIHNIRYTHSVATFYAAPTGTDWLAAGEEPTAR
ncbi:transglutaminase-like domain-containing protein [Hymenobacter sp. HSC-4F20]|uniref:transglutaminase-like domain-containing protein n=1 Tax=Hymenobacter sp. HSC-4F20 TaxID=2864135 RepID=UPI001C73172B|nr:transglutaminase-like domain-containing protein [Hymenobacter sp. HSC-4F20]MBX0290475.1 transglutaminase-like domain-containing protein [Hymenobacter sp. HSC-4F20]